MKNKINNIIDWFEEHFNFIVDITALLGSVFTIFFAIFIFICVIFDRESILNHIEVIILPGFAGFMAIIMLFALRITRHLTKEK